MHIKRIELKGFKRFEDLTVELPNKAKLVVLVGPNGCGKSSIFDAFRLWHSWHKGRSVGFDEKYHLKKETQLNYNQSSRVIIDFHEPTENENDNNSAERTFYIRSAFRNEPDFSLRKLSRIGGIQNAPYSQKMIDSESFVSDNYQRLISDTIDELYQPGKHDESKVKDFRDQFIREIRKPLLSVFSELELNGPGQPLDGGTFLFTKGISENFEYKNLSGGEKAVFDIFLDLVIKRKFYFNSVFCIDEPDAHMHTRLQAKLLETLFYEVPEDCQLWITTHSIGMLRKAKELYEKDTESVALIDFTDIDFDKQNVINPTKIDRCFWKKILTVALDDLSELVAPKRIVLCEGKAKSNKGTGKEEFDAKCYRIIFANEFPDTEFISVGSASEVESDHLAIGLALQTVIKGADFIQLIDGDDLSPQEVQDGNKEGIKVLSRRHIESYLLDDEIIKALCIAKGKEDKFEEIRAAKIEAIKGSIKRNKQPDDIKSAAGDIYNSIKRTLSLKRCGNNVNSFLRDTMAQYVTQETKTYALLKKDIFNDK